MLYQARWYARTGARKWRGNVASGTLASARQQEEAYYRFGLHRASAGFIIDGLRFCADFMAHGWRSLSVVKPPVSQR